MEHQIDASLLAWINQAWTHPALDALMVLLSTGGLAWFAVLTLLAWQRRERPIRWSLLLAQSAALVGVLLFYYLAGRARPDAARLVLAAPPLPSFPSGHAALAAATATAWWLHYRWHRRTAIIGALALGVAYSRIYLGHHFPTDVVAGMVLGIGTGAAAHGITHNWGNLRAMISWLLWPQVALALLVTMMAYLGLLPLSLLAWPYADKVLHMLLIGALAFWLNLWLPDWQLQIGRWHVPIAILLPFAVAAIEEVLQSWSPLRSFDWGDMASNLAGLLLFYALSRWVMARLPLTTPPLVDAAAPPRIAG